MAFVRVASLAELRARQASGRGLCVRLGDIEIGLFASAGKVYAMESRCPHAGAPLTEGALKGTVVTCPLHGWQIDVRTGHRPTDGDGFPLPCFAVRVVEDAIELDIEQVLNRRPERR